MPEAPSALWELLARGDPLQALPMLLALEAQWAMDADYNALLAEVALAAGRPDQATLALERLVQLQPHRAGAWLDLALASEALADHQTAWRAIAHLEQAFELPPSIRTVVADLRNRLAAATTSRQPMRWNITLLTGHDSNPNSGPAGSRLTLTLPAGAVELPLDPTSRPQPSPLLFLAADAVMRPSEGIPLEARLSWATRRLSDAPAFDTSEMAAALASGRGAVYGLIEWRGTRLGGRPLLHGPRARLVGPLGPVMQPCVAQWAAESLSHRYQADLSVHDARQLWIEAAYHCHGLGRGWSAVARLGHDKALTGRPGGSARRVDLQFIWRTVWRDRLDLTLGATLARTVDTQSYSPLLGDGAVRLMHRAGTQIELAWPRAYRRPAWQSVARLELQRQASNLELFVWQQASITVGLRRRFP